MNPVASHILFALLAMAVSVEFADGLRLSQASRQVRTTQVIPYAVVYSADYAQINAIVASIRSVVRHTKAPLNLYLFVAHEEKQQFENFTQVDGVQINKEYYSQSDVDPYINKAFTFTDGASPNLDIPQNYVRYIMAERISGAEGMVWMDADTIATADIMTDMVEFLRSGKVIGAFPQEFLAGPGIEQFHDIANTTNLPIQGKPPYFNAGFMYISAIKYRENHVSKFLQQLIAANNEHKWWTALGSQPPLNLLMGGEQFFQIRSIKYFGGMGYKHHMHTSQKGLYHWNGPHKPWLADGLYKDLWEQYADTRFVRRSTTFANINAKSPRNSMDCNEVCNGEINILKHWGLCECA